MECTLPPTCLDRIAPRRHGRIDAERKVRLRHPAPTMLPKTAENASVHHFERLDLPTQSSRGALLSLDVEAHAGVPTALGLAQDIDIRPSMLHVQESQAPFFGDAE